MDTTPQESQVTEMISEPIPDFGAKNTQTSISVKKIGGILLLIVLVFSIFGVGYFFFSSRNSGTVGGNSEPKQVTLTYWGTGEKTPGLTQAITNFQNQNPGVTIQYSFQSQKDYRERLQSACSRDQCPDIFKFHPTWTSSFSQANLLSVVPATQLSTSTYTSTFYPSAVSDLITPRGVVGIPLSTDGLGLFINTQVLKASGRSVPTTWNDVQILAKELTVRGNNGSIERSGIALGSPENVDHFSDILTLLIYQNGGDPAKVEGNTLVSDAIRFYTQFMKEDKVWDETLPNSTYAFAVEKTAMIIAPYWRVAEIKQLNPNFEFAVYPVPQLPGSPVAIANYWAEGVSASSKEQETAWKFLLYLSSKEGLEALYPQASSTAFIEKPYSRVDMGAELLSDPYAGAYIKQAPYAKTWYMSSRTFDNGLNDQMIAAYKTAIELVLKGTSFDQVGPKLSADIQAILAKYTLSK